MNSIGFELIDLPENIDTHILSGEFPATKLTALQAVMRSDTRKEKLEDILEELSIELSELGGDDADIMEKIEEITDELEGLTDLEESNAAIILHGLGFDKEMQHKKTKEFSGGWRMRIALACALFKQPALLLLDEPTNHLDMAAVIWLEDYLSKWKHSLIIISHSQDFMNAICTNIIHMTNQKLKC